ncbi:hypothetical protein V6N13_096250 [Hibiscus sabdariffa]|uniref:Uncharacterized protein n=1 Tax=Hibiscus sabdariffa TaxID=183260 RepID=A0ABR2DHW5_9ROSI
MYYVVRYYWCSGPDTISMGNNVPASPAKPAPYGPLHLISQSQQSADRPLPVCIHSFQLAFNQNSYSTVISLGDTASPVPPPNKFG